MEKLSEIPYVEIDHKVFDFQAELLNSDQIIQRLRDILSGKKVNSRNGMTIQINSESEKEDFVRQLVASKLIFNSILSRLDKNGIDEIYRMIGQVIGI